MVNRCAHMIWWLRKVIQGLCLVRFLNINNWHLGWLKRLFDVIYQHLKFILLHNPSLLIVDQHQKLPLAIQECPYVWESYWNATLRRPF